MERRRCVGAEQRRSRLRVQARLPAACGSRSQTAVICRQSVCSSYELAITLPTPRTTSVCSSSGRMRNWKEQTFRPVAAGTCTRPEQQSGRNKLCDVCQKACKQTAFCITLLRTMTRGKLVSAVQNPDDYMFGILSQGCNPALLRSACSASARRRITVWNGVCTLT